MRHQAAPAVLRKIDAAFARAGVRFLPVKGVLTASLLYPDVAERSLVDIDLRIARRDFPAALRAARAQGWQPRVDSPVLWTALFKVDGYEIDLEASFGPPGLCALSIEDAFARACTTTAPFGFPHLQPDIHDHALILALNTFKDGLRPQRWALEDLRRIPRHPALDPAKLVARAQQGRVASALWLVADWLARTHACAEWQAIRDRIGPAPPSRRVAWSYGAVRSRGWPERAGLVVSASGSDRTTRSVAALGLIAAGLVRRRAILTLRSLAERAPRR
jgi:hypothetical protein